MFIFHNSEEVWLLSKNQQDKVWHGKINAIPQIGDMVQGINTFLGTNKLDTCLSLGETLNDTIPFAMRSPNCEEKRSVVWVLKTTTQMSYQKPPKFPCIPKHQPTRNKREWDDKASKIDDEAKKGRPISYI